MKRSQTQKNTHWMIYFMYDFGNGTNIRRKKQKQKNKSMVAKGWRGWKKLIKRGHKGTSGVIEMFCLDFVGNHMTHICQISSKFTLLRRKFTILFSFNKAKTKNEKPRQELSIVKNILSHDKIVFFFFFGLLLFVGPLPWHMEIPRLGVRSEL